MLTIMSYVGRANDATMWETIATEETDGPRDAASSYFAVLARFEASRPWGGDERGLLSCGTELAIDRFLDAQAYARAA